MNLFENIQKGSALESIAVELNVQSLFDADTEALSPPELTCLKLIASKAPADWSDIIETVGVDIVQNLVNKRLIIRSGDRLNIYWDIFKDYLLTGKAPVVPFNYVPTNDLPSLITIVKSLSSERFKGLPEIASSTGFGERTVMNITSDLVMFGIAERLNSEIKLTSQISEQDEKAALLQLRSIFAKHSLKIDLYKKHMGQMVSKGTVLTTLRKNLAGIDINDKTLNAYANRLLKYLTVTGYLSPVAGGWQIRDLNQPIPDASSFSRKRHSGKPFSVLASPKAVVDALQFINAMHPRPEILDGNGYRNALDILHRLSLVGVINGKLQLVEKTEVGTLESKVKKAVASETTFKKCIELLTKRPNATSIEIGQFIAQEFKVNWKPASLKRNGNAYKQWSQWLMVDDTTSSNKIPGRSKKIPLSYSA